MWPFNRRPAGFVLYRADGTRRNVIRGDLVPAGTTVIVQDGQNYVATGKSDPSFGRDWPVYREGHKVFEYVSPND